MGVFGSWASKRSVANPVAFQPFAASPGFHDYKSVRSVALQFSRPSSSPQSEPRKPDFIETLSTGLMVNHLFVWGDEKLFLVFRRSWFLVVSGEPFEVCFLPKIKKDHRQIKVCRQLFPLCCIATGRERPSSMKSDKSPAFTLPAGKTQQNCIFFTENQHHHLLYHHSRQIQSDTIKK